MATNPTALCVVDGLKQGDEIRKGYGMTVDYKEGDLQVWWKPALGLGAIFTVGVKDVAEGAKIINILADYDLLIESDYTNAGGLQIFANGDWDDWIDEETGDDDPALWVERQEELAKRGTV